MRMYPREFPSIRRRKPKRRAERQVYEALAGSGRRGFVYYEWRKGYGHIEIDFAVWVEGLGRFALQVKGGRYGLVDGEWHLKRRDGLLHVASCPLDETKLAALDLHDDIAELAQTAYNPFVVPVLVLPDMEPDDAINNLAKRRGVYPVWGADRLMADLTGIARSRGRRHPLAAARIADEVYAITDGLIRLSRGTGDTPQFGEDEEARSADGRPPAWVMRVTAGGKVVITVRANNIHRRLGNHIPTAGESDG